MSTVVITGGAGFIGSNLALTWQKTYPNDKIIIIDNFSGGSWRNLVGFEGDIISQNLSDINFSKLPHADFIFHQAAITDTKINDQKFMMNQNYDTFKNIMSYALFSSRGNHVSIVYASSSAVYGNTPVPFVEDSNEIPHNVYGFSKLMLDRLTQKLTDSSKSISIAGLRYVNVYGPGEQDKGGPASMIFHIIKNLREHGYVNIFKDGKQARDWVFIDDVVQANMVAGFSQLNGVFNVGTGVKTTFNNLVQSISQIMVEEDFAPRKNPNNISYLLPPKNYQNFTQVNIDKLCSSGFSVKFPLEKGVRKFIKWIKENKIVG